MRTTLSQWKEKLLFEANGIEKKLERGIGTTEEKQRLKEIYKKLEIVDAMKK